MERLADRLAMIVSDDGEAGNAGVAAAHLARRMGLTGGQLKAMLLSGGTEMVELKHSVAQLDLATRRAQDEASRLRDVGERLQGQLDRANSTLRTQRVVGIVVVAATALGGLVATLVPGIGGPARPVPAGLATTRVANAELHREPDQASPLVARLPVGAKVTVHRLVWHTLTQWAEVDAGGQSGYVSTNDVDLP